MMVRRVEYGQDFARALRKLPLVIQRQAVKKEELFKSNPLHPSLRLHQLKGKLGGLWSISITFHYRIIFRRMDDGVIVFVSIGRHAIYDR